MHRRGLWRRLRSSLQTLLQVAGWVTLGLGLLLGGLALAEQFSTRQQLLRMAALYGAGGAALVILHGLCFRLPTWLAERGSQASRQRRGEKRRRRRPPADAPAREGMALVLVLIALALIATLVVQIQFTSRATARRGEVRASRARLLQAATEAARFALQRVADDPDLLADTTNDPWAVTLDLTRPDGVAVRARVEDEDRRFDLNNLSVARAAPARRSPHDILFEVFTLCGDFQSSSYLDALGDWVDDDRAGLYESVFYSKREPPHGTPDRVAYSWAETTQVEGGSRDRFLHHTRESTRREVEADLLDCLTLLPLARHRPLPININTADPAVLQGVLGVGQDTLVRTILTLRELKPIRDFASLEAVAEPDTLPDLRPWLAVRSHFFRVDVRAAEADRSLRLQALAQRDDAGRVRILQWVF